MRCSETDETADLKNKESAKLAILDEEYAVVHCTGYLKVNDTPCHSGLGRSTYCNP